MRKLTHPEKRLFGIVAALILFYLGKVYVGPWRVGESRKFTQREESNREKLIKVLEKIHQSKLLFEKRREYFTLFTLKGTTEEQLNSIRNDLTQMSKTIPIVIGNIQTGDIQEEKTFSTVSLQISAQGNWSHISRFIYKLENTPYFFKIINLSMEQNLSDDAAVKVRLTVNRSFFIISEH